MQWTRVSPELTDLEELNKGLLQRVLAGPAENTGGRTTPLCQDSLQYQGTLDAEPGTLWHDSLFVLGCPVAVNHAVPCGAYGQKELHLCSRMWGTPVESLGGVRKVMPNTLFSSGTDTDITSAPVFLCLNNTTLAPYSSTMSSFTISYLSKMGAVNSIVVGSDATMVGAHVCEDAGLLLNTLNPFAATKGRALPREEMRGAMKRELL